MTQGQREASTRRLWSWSIGRVLGIDIRVHVTFVLLFGWVLVSQLIAGRGVAQAGQVLFTVSGLFGIVVLHELGHALAARHFGIATRDITLLPIGGVARLERMPTEPTQELLVALAGPAVNIVLAMLAGVGVAIVGGSWVPSDFATEGSWLVKLLWINVGLAVFNLLPAFPMDGGRVLRALFALRMSRTRATDLSARIGQWMALGFGLVGLLVYPMLVVIALFVWVGAAQEAALVHVSEALGKVRVGDAMVTTFDVLDAELSVGAGVEKAIHSLQRNFPVVKDGRLVGFVTARDLVRCASRGGTAETVGAVAQVVPESAHPNEPVEQALRRLQQANVEVLPVLENGQLVGILVPENVMQVVGLRDVQMAPG